jgi:four helix bundle protein
MAISSYQDLMVWQRSMDLVTECYRLTECFPRTEVYGLSSQLQRAAVSVPANIAEGAGRGHTKEFIRHLGIARGSLFEVQTHVMISARLGYATAEQVQPIIAGITETGRMLHGLIASLERKVATEC